MSLAQQLCHKTRDAIISHFGLTEVGSPYRVIHSQIPPGAPVGELRIWRGEQVRKLVYVGLTVPMIQLDSHMLFAFTPADSPLPHFTLDSVLAGPHFAFHLDLLPRVDLGSNLAYLNELFQPLTEPFNSAKAIEGLTPAHLSPRQYAIMSPWMLAYRATEEAFQQIDAVVGRYLAHWRQIMQQKLSVHTYESLDTHNFARRDQRNRAAIFNADVDPVWNQLKPLIGEAMSAEMQAVLRNQEVEEA